MVASPTGFEPVF